MPLYGATKYTNNFLSSLNFRREIKKKDIATDVKGQVEVGQGMTEQERKSMKKAERH